MKKLLYKNIVLLTLVAFVFSCTDDSLDPVQIKNVKKGTILALRGTQLDNLYFNGIPGAEVFPKLMTGTEKFAFDAEFLSGDLNSLTSVDVYVVKKTGSATSRILMSNVPFSSFKTDATYKGPWMSVSYTLSQVLAKLGLPVASDPIYKGNAGNPLLTTYQPGIVFETDLNLADGTKVLASQIVAAGLFQSDQFYPAQILTWTMTDYCEYDAASWAGIWSAAETIPPASASAPYASTFTAAGTDKYTMSNWRGNPAASVVFTFTPSDGPNSQTLELLKQNDGTGNSVTGTDGVYDQCNNNMTIVVTVTPAVGSKVTFSLDIARP